MGNGGIKSQGYNWKFARTGHVGVGVKYMACEGDKLVREFSPKASGWTWLSDAICFEKSNNFTGHKIKNFIYQCNFNAVARRNHIRIKTDIPIMSLKDFNQLQKIILEKEKETK